MQKLILICLIYFTSRLFSQAAFINYNISNSDLPLNQINKIFIDANQSKWICTENGLAKLDAENNWTIYNISNSGLPDNYIRSVHVDDENILWVGTYLGGLNKI